MKLLRLKIIDPAGFRSLEPGFEIFFLRELNYDEANEFNPYILAGPNGSGKSNVLEALAAIFFHIDCMYLDFRPNSFAYDEVNNPNGFRSTTSSPNGFELEYFIANPIESSISKSSNYAHIKIIKENGKVPNIFWVNKDLSERGEYQLLSSIEAKDVLPKFVLGYSSGENEILSLPFFKMRFIHFDEYMDSILRLESYFNTPEGRLTFLNSEFNQAILLSNFLRQSKDLLKPFTEEVGVEDIMRFRIIIKKYYLLHDNDATEEFQNAVSFQRGDKTIDVNEFHQEEYKLDIIRNLQGIIEKLKNCSTFNYYNSDADELYLDYSVNDETKKAFEYYFPKPIELFQAFQILLTLNLYTVSDTLKKELYQSTSLYVNEIVPTLPADERIMRFKDLWMQKKGASEYILSKSLSDGEHQFLHSLGLCLLYKDENCLFLLDEPETHFNPDWRAKFISRLRDCFSDKDLKDKMREMLITTHTPFLISDSKTDYVLVFKKNKENKKIEVSRPDYNTFGASINKITMKTFGKMETIGGYAEAQLNEIKKRFQRGESKQLLIDEVNGLFGDSVEKSLFINYIMNFRENQ